MSKRNIIGIIILVLLAISIFVLIYQKSQIKPFHNKEPEIQKIITATENNPYITIKLYRKNLKNKKDKQIILVSKETIDNKNKNFTDILYFKEKPVSTELIKSSVRYKLAGYKPYCYRKEPFQLKDFKNLTKIEHSTPIFYSGPNQTNYIYRIKEQKNKKIFEIFYKKEKEVYSSITTDKQTNRIEIFDRSDIKMIFEYPKTIEPIIEPTKICEKYD